MLLTDNRMVTTDLLSDRRLLFIIRNEYNEMVTMAKAHTHGEQTIRPTPAKVSVPDSEPNFAKLAAMGVAQIGQQFKALAKLIENRSTPVDDYQIEGGVNLAQLDPQANSGVQVLPEFECDERITGIIVTGPPTTTPTFNLQIGERIWTLQLPVTGILVISPISLTLNRNDLRVLTSATAGDWTLELFGWADQ
jgi:hypothetical protein